MSVQPEACRANRNWTAGQETDRALEAKASRAGTYQGPGKQYLVSLDSPDPAS